MNEGLRGVGCKKDFARLVTMSIGVQGDQVVWDLLPMGVWVSG